MNLAVSTTHCGACGKACSARESCDDGRCALVVGDGCTSTARALRITKVSAFQVVEVPLFDAGQLVADSARPAPLIEGKSAMVRVHVAPLKGFSTREVSARVYLEAPGSEPLVFFGKQRIAGASSQSELDTTLNVTIPAEAMRVDGSFRVELTDCAAATGDVDAEARVPVSGNAALTLQRTGRIEVAFLPIKYNGMTPDVSEAALKRYADEVMKLYAATAVTTTVLPTYGNYSGPVDLGDLLDDVRAKRSADRPAANVYYYGLVRSHKSFRDYCASSCTTGVAFVPQSSAAFRAGVGIGYGDAESAGTFAHELGHNHERNHAPCGGAANADSKYPYAGAKTGVWGYDLLAGTLKSPTEHTDFMGYCEPTWASDYTYRATTAVIRELNGQARVLAGSPVRFEALRVRPRGLSWTHPVELTEVPADARSAVVYGRDGRVLANVTAYRIERSEGDGHLLLVPPRQADWYAVGELDGPALPYER